MRHFKLPIIVTGVTLALAMAFVIGAATWIHGSSLSNREKQRRGELLGSGAATLTCVVIAPFWLISAARFGKERREARQRVRGRSR